MNQLDDITVTDRSGRSVDHQLLPDRDIDSSYTWTTSPCIALEEKCDLPARIFDDPPVVDIFEGITGDLLLVRAAPPIVIPELKTGNIIK